MATPDRLRSERDVYRALLALGAADDPRPLLESALACVVEALGATQGYLALFDGAALDEAPAFALGRACTADDVAELSQRLSRGIVREALERGETINTACALEDPRFAALESVSLRGIRAVLCAPLGDAQLGVLYVQGRAAAGPFTAEDRRLLEDVAAQVAPWAERLLERTEVSDPTVRYRQSLKGLEGLAGRSAALAHVLSQVALVAPLDVSLLLRGPSGSGKTALARAIHVNGPRALGPFVELNCAALPEGLVESELFGAARGAHSTADRAIVGKVGAADGGTLLLDEVAELPLSAQAKLLTFLQSKRYHRLGAPESELADVRVIAATHADLERAVADKRFREDLFYRLAVLPIELPGLEARREDIEPIATLVVDAAARRHGFAALPLSPRALSALREQDWPGQVRQLANVVEAGLIRAHGAGATAIAQAHFSGVAPTAEASEPTGFHEATRQFQRSLVERALDSSDWNVSAAARALDISRSRLNELIRGFGLERPRA